MCLRHKWVTFEAEDIAFATRCRICLKCNKIQGESYTFEGDIEWDEIDVFRFPTIISLLDCDYKKCDACNLRYTCWTVKHETEFVREL